MRNTLQRIVILLSIYFIQTVHSAPVRLAKLSHVKGSGVTQSQKQTKSQIKHEKSEAKSDLHKKTTVSVNGQVLPLASVSTEDKNIHVTIQKANPTGQQLPPSIQEVQTGNQVPIGNVGLSPGYQPPGGAQIPGGNQIQGPPFAPPGLHPGFPGQNELNNNGMNPGLSPGYQPPGNQNLQGLSPGYEPPPGQNVGMHPGLSNGQNNGISNTGIPNNGIPNQGIPNQNQGIQTNCGNSNLPLGQQGTQNHQVVLGTNSDGQLTYRPTC